MRREPGREIRHLVRDRDRLLRDVLDQQRAGPRAPERHIPREHLIRDDAQRIEIAAAIDFAIARALLGTHVGRRPDRHPGRGQPRVRAAGVADRARDAEVGHHRAPTIGRQQDVVRLDVAVDYAARMGVGEGARHLRQQPPRLRDGHPGIPGQTPRQRVAVDVRHDEEHQSLTLVDREDRNNVGMRQLRGGLGLTQKPRANVGAKRQLRRQDFDRDRPLEPAVSRQVHDPHPAAPDLPVELERLC